MTPNQYFHTPLTCRFNNNRSLLSISAASPTGLPIVFAAHAQAPQTFTLKA
jgi:hypothetical protein